MANYSIKCNGGANVFFDFDSNMVNYTRSSSMDAKLGIIDIEVPFDSITGFIVKKPSFLTAGSFSLIVNGKALFTQTGNSFTDSDLTEVHVPPSAFKEFEEAIETFRKKVKNVTVYKKGDIKLERANYTKSTNPFETNSKEYRIRCNVCGHVYCFTNQDLKDNEQAAKMAKRYAIGQATGALSGNMFSAYADGQNANNALNRITDYSRCPKCNSTNVSVLEDGQEFAPQSSGASVSAADELRKFKELLDSGVISQEEFDAKKKQLLGL